MTDYSLLEVILNGDSPAPTRVIEGVLQPVAPTTTEQRLARKNELKACCTLLMALLDKHQLKFNTHKDAKTLMEAIEKRSLPYEWRTHTFIWRNKTDLEEQSLDDLFNSLKIYEAKVKISSSASTTTQNIAFLSSSNTNSTNEPLSATASISVIDADNLEEMNLKWQMAILTVECYNCHMKGNFTRECRSPKDTRRNGATEPQRRNVLIETSTSNALVSQCDEQERDDLKLKLEKFQTSSKNLSELLSSQTNDKTCLGYNSQVFTRAMFDWDDYLSSGSDESFPPSPIYDMYQSGNGYHDVSPPYTGTFMPPKPDLVFNNASNDVEIDHPAFIDESKTKTPQNVSSFVQSTEQVKSPRLSVQHVETSIPTATFKIAIPKPTSNAKHMIRKACFVCKSLDHLIKYCEYYDKKMAQTTPRNTAQRGTHKQYAQMTLPNPQRHVVPAAIFPYSNLVSITAVRPDKGVIDTGCSRHMTGNMSYLSDFKEFNSGYVTFGGNPNGGKISRKGKIRTGKLDFNDVYFVKELKFNLFSVSQMCDTKNSVLFTDTECLVLSPNFKLPDENQMLLRVPRENNMYNVNLKNIVPSGDLTCLFAKATLDESNLWHRRLGHINFKTINKLVK
nr:ribonuclease H-like domain-containing protein [Tanacetum cinerariifolium]